MSKSMNEVVIISEELLKMYSPMSANVGVAKVFPYVLLAQDFHIRPILGDALLNDLQNAVSDGNLDELQKALIVKVAPVLANWTTYMALRTLAWTITEKGITKEHSENSEPIKREELGDLLHQIKETAEKAEEMLIRYLCTCHDSYPSWQPYNECDCSKYEQQGGSTKACKSFGIFIPNREKPNKCGCEGNNKKPTAPMWKELQEYCETE